jgi:predicted TIM-barrel fold metal-dependent hydrolase
MLIADAQVHIWAASTVDRPWPTSGRSEPHRLSPFSADDLLTEMDAAGVDRVVIVPPSWEGDRNDLAIDACRVHPSRFAIMGRFDPNSANAPRLANWRSLPGMLGMRFTLRPHHGWLTDGSVEWLWQAAERHGLPVMLSCPGLLPIVDGIAERYPALRLVIDHLALIRTLDAAAFADLSDLLAMARRPNVAVKASALPCFSSERYPYRNLHPYIRQVFDAFGPRRMFWGTDLTRLPCSYRQAITMFTEELPFLSAGDKDLIMGRGLCDFLGWPLPQ